MRAIVLSAGVGNRMRPITENKPKTLVTVKNVPIISHIMNALQKNQVKDVVLCTGFMAEELEKYCKEKHPGINFTFVRNNDYQKTNNMYSLYLAKNYLDSDVIIMNSDLVFEPGIITEIMNKDGSCIPVDTSNYFEESMKVFVEGGFVRHISKTISKQDAFGCSIDIYKITKNDCTYVKNELIRIIEHEKEFNQWTEVMLDNLFISGKIKARPVDIKGRKWFEIDNLEDLQKAEMIFNEKFDVLKEKKIFFLDSDGTLSLGKQKLGNSDEFIDSISKKGKIFYILTNNSSKTPYEHCKKFRDMGININEDNILFSLQPAIDYLKENNLTEVFWLANKNVSEYISNSGINFNDKNPKGVLLTFDTEINYEKILKLIKFTDNGVPFIATHSDVRCPVEDGYIPDIGSFIKMVEMTTGRIPDKIFGKPEKNMIESVLKKHSLSQKDAVIIGDRLYTDIKLAENSDITSILVLSGETSRTDYEFSETNADIIVSKIGDIIPFL